MPVVGHWTVGNNRGDFRGGEKNGKLGRALAPMSRENACIQSGGGWERMMYSYVPYGLGVLYTLQTTVHHTPA